MKREIGKEYLLLLLRAGGFLILMWLLFSRVFFLTRVQGMDMWPSLKDGDLAFGVRIGQEYQSGDVIAYEEADGLSFARIIGEAEDQEKAWIVEKDSLETATDTVTDTETGAGLSETEKAQGNQVLSKKQIRGKVLTIFRRRV